MALFFAMASVLISCISGLVSPVSGEVFCDGVISWPVGGQGGLDRNLRISDALDFLSIVYSDCLEKSHVSVNEFWELLSGLGVHHCLTLKELSRNQKQFFYLGLSILFSFDFYLIDNSGDLSDNLTNVKSPIIRITTDGDISLGDDKIEVYSVNDDDLSVLAEAYFNSKVISEKAKLNAQNHKETGATVKVRF